MLDRVVDCVTEEPHVGENLGEMRDLIGEQDPTVTQLELKRLTLRTIRKLLDSGKVYCGTEWDDSGRLLKCEADIETVLEHVDEIWSRRLEGSIDEAEFRYSLWFEWADWYRAELQERCVT